MTLIIDGPKAFCIGRRTLPVMSAKAIGSCRGKILLHGGNDSYIEEYDLLPNVRSLALQLYSNADDAGSHCNMGNMKLALDTMISWIELINGKNGEKEK